MANVRITDKPELTKDFDKVVLLGSDPADLKDYKVTPEGLAKIVSGRVIYDVTCSTATDDAAKTVIIDNFTEGVQGTVLWVTFENGNTAESPTLSVNGQTPASLQVQGNPIPPLFIEAGKKYKLEYISSTWNFTNQSLSGDELFDTVYGVAKNLDEGDYNVNDIKEVGRYTWTTKVPAGIVIEGRTEEDNKYGSLTVTKVGSGNDRKQLINFGIDNSQFSRTNPGGNNPWGKWRQTATKDMLDVNVTDVNKKISDVIDGTTPVTKIDETATKGGNEVATVNQFSDGTVTVISDTATNVSKSRVAFRSDTYTKQEVDDIVSTVYKYKGSVPTFADLPKDDPVGTNKVGDVYNVEDTGLNWAWDGKRWDELGMNIDTSQIVTKSEVMHNNSVMLWDGTNSKAKTIDVPANSKGKVLVYNGPDVEPTYEKYKTASSWTGTKAEFEEAKKVTDPESDNFISDKSIVNITDDGQTGNVSSEVREGDFNPVSGDAVSKYKTTEIAEGNNLPVTSDTVFKALAETVDPQLVLDIAYPLTIGYTQIGNENPNIMFSKKGSYVSYWNETSKGSRKWNRVEKKDWNAPQIETLGSGRDLLTILPVTGSTTAEKVKNAFAILKQRVIDRDYSGLQLGDYIDLPQINTGSRSGAGVITNNPSYQNLRVEIYGSDFYDYGGSLANPGILFGFKNVVYNKRMNPSDTNAGGYTAAELYPIVNEDFAAGLTEVIGFSPKTIHRTLDKGYGTSETVWSSEVCFLPTELEYFGTRGDDNGNYYGMRPTPRHENVSKTNQYTIFQKIGNNAGRIKKYNGGSAYPWEASSYKSGSAYFAFVGGGGNAYYVNASNDYYGVSPAFYIG